MRRPAPADSMRRLPCALWLMLASACSDDVVVVVGELDASLVDADDTRCPAAARLSLCNPLAPVGMQGCSAGHKCTWLVVRGAPEPFGKVSCVPDGVAERGRPCTVGAPGEATGFDDCQAGNICVAGACRDICGFGGGAAEACAAGASCVRVDYLWSTCGADPMYGVCYPSCDPVTQRLPDGASCGAGRGCYLLVNSTTTTAVCANAGTVGHGDVISGGVFANSCLPGLQPRRANPDDPTIECGALCAVRDVFVTDPDHADRGARPLPRPAAQVTNFAAEGGATPFDCARAGAAPPDDPIAGESCRYWWAREPFGGLSPYSNAVGWCFAHTRFRFDSDDDLIDDAPFPRCAAVSGADQVPPFASPPADDAVSFWCKARPALLHTSMRHVQTSLAHEVTPDRLHEGR